MLRALYHIERVCSIVKCDESHIIPSKNVIDSHIIPSNNVIASCVDSRFEASARLPKGARSGKEGGKLHRCATDDASKRFGEYRVF